MNFSSNKMGAGWMAAALMASTLISVPVHAGESSPHVPRSSIESFPTNQIIIKYKESAEVSLSAADAPARMQALSAAAGIEIQYHRPMSGDAHVLRLPQRMPVQAVEEIARKLSALAEVEYAEPDYIRQPLLTPNDPQYSSQWHYFETYGLNLPPAWDIVTGTASVVVAVIDTGYRPHNDMSGRFVQGYDFIGLDWYNNQWQPLTANDGDGRDSDPSDPGDWITSSENSSGFFQGCPVSNSSWHGTHVAGTIGANSNNANGVAGVNWGAKILPVRVLGKCGGYDSDIADGMRWAAGLTVSGVPANANPAKVLNLSLGGGGACPATYQSAINQINALGRIIVVAAGNSNANASGFTPANCNGVITVGATDRTGLRAYYSNYGAVVDVSAPGGETSPTSSNGVLSTLNTGTQGPVADNYVFYQGTSMATPHVAGVVSLMATISPTLNYTRAEQILKTTVRSFGPGNDCATVGCGTGIVNAQAAVNAVRPLPPLNRRAYLPVVYKNYPAQVSNWTIIASEDFEGAFPQAGWQTFDDDSATNGEYFFAKRNCQAYAGSYSAWVIGGGANGGALACGANYPHNALAWLVYGPFSLTDATAAQLTFWQSINSEIGFDYLWRLASTDGTNFYGSGTSGNTSGWVSRTLDLANVPTLGNLLGQSQVWIALVFESDGSVNYPNGAYVDNIVLRKCTSASCAGLLTIQDQTLLDGKESHQKSIVETEGHKSLAR
ncbi:MAG: S8 family serine peptidase [Anaerolineae bacterium]|nr:S8 family serine peptidase [Thermoflexales bacterium]MDW8408043.1 S8 family serine peptidase [Anaerolineae bacterium]